MTTRRRAATPIALLFLVSLVASASAQVDDRARALLEGLRPVVTEDLRNVDQSVVTTVYTPDGQSMVTNARIVIDYEGRRIAMITEMAPGMSTRLVLKDGNVTMSMAGMPMVLPAPPESAAQLEQMFDQNEPLAIEEGDIATYDGVVDYGGIVSGEQVTYTFHDEAGEPTTIQYLFEDGKIVGLHMVVEDAGEVLVVYDTPADARSLAAYDATTYMLDGGAWTKLSHAHVEAVAYNQALDESLFE